MLTLFTALVSGVVASVVTLYLQNHFWGYQRISELRLRTIDGLNSLAAQLMAIYSRPNYQAFTPDDELLRTFYLQGANVKALFSAEAYECFNKLQAMIPPNPSMNHQEVIDGFIVARDAMLSKLYAEFVSPGFAVFFKKTQK